MKKLLTVMLLLGLGAITFANEKNNVKNLRNFSFICYDKKSENKTGNMLYQGCLRSNEKCSNIGKLHFGKYPNDSKAQEAFKRCSKGNPKLMVADTLYETGLQAKKKGDFKKAAEIFQKVSQNRYYSNLMSQAYLDRGEFYDGIKAKHLFAKAIKASQNREQEINARIALKVNLKIVSIEDIVSSKKPNNTEVIDYFPPCLNDNDMASVLARSKKENLVAYSVEGVEAGGVAGYAICAEDSNKTLLQKTNYMAQYYTAAVFSSDETKVVLAMYGFIEVWDITLKRRLARLPSIIEIDKLSFSKDEKLIIGEDHEHNKTITYEINDYSHIDTQKRVDLKEIHNFADGKNISKKQQQSCNIDFDTKAFKSKFFVESNSILMYDGEDYYSENVLLYDCENRHKISLKGIVSGPITIQQIDFSKDRNVVLLAYGWTTDGEYYDKGFLLYDIKRKDIIFSWKSETVVEDAKFFNDDKTIVFLTYPYYEESKATYLGKISIMDRKTKQIIYEQKLPNNSYNGIDISQNSQTLLLTKDGRIVEKINLYDAAIPKHLIVLKTEVDTGSYLTESGKLRIMTVQEWRDKKKKLQFFYKNGRK